MLTDNDVWPYPRKKWIFNRHKHFNSYLDSKPIWFFKRHKKMSNFWIVITCYIGIWLYRFTKYPRAEILKLGVHRVHRSLGFTAWFQRVSEHPEIVCKICECVSGERVSSFHQILKRAAPFSGYTFHPTWSKAHFTFIRADVNLTYVLPSLQLLDWVLWNNLC